MLPNNLVFINLPLSEFFVSRALGFHLSLWGSETWAYPFARARLPTPPVSTQILVICHHTVKREALEEDGSRGETRRPAWGRDRPGRGGPARRRGRAAAEP